MTCRLHTLWWLSQCSFLFPSRSCILSYAMAFAVYKPTSGPVPPTPGHKFACKSLSPRIPKSVLELETHLAPKLHSLVASAGQCGWLCWPFLQIASHARAALDLNSIPTGQLDQR